MTKKTQFYGCILLVLFLFLTVSCKNDKKEKNTSTWVGKQIYFPQNTPCIMHGRDSLTKFCKDSLRKEYKILFYVDSTGCNSCRMKLLEWKQIISEAEILFPNKVDFLFYFQPKSIYELKNILSANLFDYPIFVDDADSINTLNQFPKTRRSRTNQFSKSIQNECFLLNKEDMASKTEEYYINFFKEHHLEEAIDEIKAVTEKNKSFFQRFVNHEEVDAKEMRDFMEPYRFIKSKYILKKSSKS